MASQRFSAVFLLLLISTATALPPIYGCGSCTPSRPKPPDHHHHHKPPQGKPPKTKPPVIIPPPVINPPVTIPPPSHSNPPSCPPPSGGYPGTKPPPPPAHCPIDALKLGLCVDLLGGLVHVGLGDPAVNVCCPVLQGLLELEAAICLCTALRLKVLNLNIFLPIALQLLATCGKKVPPGFTCPPIA